MLRGGGGGGRSEQNLDSFLRDDESMMDDSTVTGTVTRGTSTAQESSVGARHIKNSHQHEEDTRKRLSTDELVQSIRPAGGNVGLSGDANSEDVESAECTLANETNTSRRWKFPRRMTIVACLGLILIVTVAVVTIRMLGRSREDPASSTTTTTSAGDESSPEVDTSQLPCVWPNLQDCGTEIIFNHIQLSGSMPSTVVLATSPNVTHLQLVGTELTGPIPSEIGLFTALTFLQLETNRLTGQIPTELGLLSKLHVLSLAVNNLEGSIPKEIGDLSQLSQLHLSLNLNMESSLPTEIGMLTELRVLNCADLSITGTIPTEVALLAHIETLRFGENYLSGTIPTEIGLLKNLNNFDLVDNRISGTVPTEIGLLSNLQILNLAFNSLSGTLPLEICGLDVTPEVECFELECSCCHCCTTGGWDGCKLKV